MARSVVLLLWLVLAAAGWTAERPNVVWIVTEDNAPRYLRLYNPEAGAPMPNIERLAEEGIVFEHAFSNAPVCSVARTTLITGCYAPRIMGQYHRRTEFAPMPGDLEMFPHYLRQAGYYTTNNHKTDYNVEGIWPWDESSPEASYRNRAEGQPFFHVQNYTTTHEGRLHFSKEEMEEQGTLTDPAELEPLPYHPDTATFRYTQARLLDQHRKADEQMGEFLAQLESDGLMDDTIIFYYGDHGGVLPGSKGYAREDGLRVPLVIRVPEKWSHLSPFASGSRAEPFVAFVDFGATVLNLAGVEPPAEMDGEPFLGAGVSEEDLAERNVVFGYADRFDEKYDLVRTLRVGRYKYVRNYQPFNIDGLYNEYRYRMLAYREWRELFWKGELSEEQAQFFRARPPEQLFNVENDPHEVKDLSGLPEYADTLQELRGRLADRVKGMPDLSFFPEPVLLEEALEDPAAFGERRKGEIAKLVDLADCQFAAFADVERRIRRALVSRDPWQRYWGLIVCSAFGEEAKSLAGLGKRVASRDEQPLVRARAAEFLALIGQGDPVSVQERALALSDEETEALLILNTMALLKDLRLGYEFDVDPSVFPAAWTEGRKSEVARRLRYLAGDDAGA